MWTQLNTDKSEKTKKEEEVTQLENELLAYVWLLNAILIPLRYFTVRRNSDQGRQGT